MTFVRTLNQVITMNLTRLGHFLWTAFAGAVWMAMTFGSSTLGQEAAVAKPRPIRALLITGGCCHDYPRQIEIITQGISQRANVAWEVFHGVVDQDRLLAIYQTDHWADGYDIVVHNECYGAVTDAEFVNRIVKGHVEQGVPALVIHCSMHSYRNANTDEWRKLLGVTSRRHEQGGRKLDVTNRAADNPIMRAFPATWQTPNGELYVIEKTWPDCHVLATAYGVDTQIDHPVIWTNTYGKARVFGTTLGHHNETMLSEPWLDVVARGLLWACDKLQPDGSPTAGYSGTGKARIVLGLR
jgi:type 1 glutamine amidotransferase